MADVRDTQSNAEVFDEVSRNRTANDIRPDSPGVGVYERPATSTSGGVMRILLILVVLLLLAYLLFQWLT